MLISIEENPYVRYNVSDTGGNISEKFAKILQKEMDNYGKLDSDFEALKTKKRATLVIVDRGFDMISPFLHEFTYQAMMNDVLALVGGRYVYHFNLVLIVRFKSDGANPGADGQIKNFSNLDESDAIMVF
jgi:syntaxin-binding protein 1